jgi:hypothetical protein
MFAGTGQEAGSWLRFYYFRKRVNDFTIFGKTRKRFYGLRRVEFIFSQSAPAICLPCRQTDDVCRLYHVFSGTCRGLSLKKCVKLALTAFWRTESEVSFSFDQFYLAAFFFAGRRRHCSQKEHRIMRLFHKSGLFYSLKKRKAFND